LLVVLVPPATKSGIGVDEGVGVFVGVKVGVALLVGVKVGVALFVGVLVFVGVIEGVIEGVGVGEGQTEEPKTEPPLPICKTTPPLFKYPTGYGFNEYGSVYKLVLEAQVGKAPHASGEEIPAQAPMADEPSNSNPVNCVKPIQLGQSGKEPNNKS
jgi:hypothetical protein